MDSNNLATKFIGNEDIQYFKHNVETFKISSVKLEEGVTPTIIGRDFVIATLAAPTVMKEPEKPAEAEAEAAEGDEKTEEGKEAAPATDGDKDKKEAKDGAEKKAPEAKK